ncbi:vitamin B12 dependent-methionine synthase activation domain-containing protein [candidate division CSSED10-310 bacterium]|uniref:Vitamin B12 dependent-methionine synthase activation domain-containing protein n=1 Tax=candidate division CSSED10-310 bacterium TaxID=2855610 RepID=A0ABV6Z1C7_UNCC1
MDWIISIKNRPKLIFKSLHYNYKMMSQSLPPDYYNESFSISIDQRAVFRLQGYTRPEDQPDERVLELYEHTMEIAQPLLHPRGICSFHKISEIKDSHIFLSNSPVLSGKNIARTFRGADILCVGLVTIGSELEEQVRLQFQENNLATGLMLDSIGSEAAEGVAIYLDNHIGQVVKSYGWHRTPRMSPGYGSFDIREQKHIFTMVDHQRVSVTLTPSCIMVPQKSVSFVIGCGENVRHFDNLSPCRVCDVKDCPVRDPASARCQQ